MEGAVLKVMFFLHRRADFDPAAFEQYSRDMHVPLVSRVPGLRRYAVNHSLPAQGAPAHACDAVAELWFESAETFQAAIASPEGTAALADQPNYLDMARTHALVVDECVVR
jgi:uncharacterized protein (TIGR02118 family)